MALHSSGPISFQQINVELKLTATAVCEADSAIWAAFNPTTDKYNLKVQSYETGEYTLQNPDYDLIIVPCIGTATVNQTTLDTFKSARLPKGKTATLNVPPSTLCAVVYLYPVNQE